MGCVNPIGPIPATLPSGKTVVGVYDVEGTAHSVHEISTRGYLLCLVYWAPGQQVEYIQVGGTSPTCTGTSAEPTAPAGFTCIYEIGRNNVSNAGVNFTTNSGVAIVAASELATGNYAAWGTWAATGK